MSTYEYNDLYLKCQHKGNYHMFIFDIVDSKKMEDEARYEAQIKMVNLMNNIYEKIKEIEQNQNKKILVFEDNFVTFKSNLQPIGFGFKQEPFLIGDTFGFTVYKDSIDKKTIENIYNYYKQSLKIDFDFHLADGFYETNEYQEASAKYFRGYCLDLLRTIHKKETIKTLNKIKTKYN